MALFETEERVMVVDQTSQYRGHYGTVGNVDDETGITDVRIDGHSKRSRIKFPEKSLMFSTLDRPIEYPEIPDVGGDAR